MRRRRRISSARTRRISRTSAAMSRTSRSRTSGPARVPFATSASARVVAYGTHYGGFVDSVGPLRKKNLADGDRYGTRVSILWQPAPEVKVTPRMVYQVVNVNGFNREEKYNLYDN